MTVAEAQSFLRGQDRRHRQAWEQTRVLGGLVHKVLTGQNWEPRFPWDDEYLQKQDDDTSAEELRALRAHARQVENYFNSKGNL